eukprot:GSChrysophyteH1.ASY1.ANO1.1279.1 assembled CDS
MPSEAMQGAVTGVIVPPKEIRVVVDKTAAFVAKNGKIMEERIRNSAEGRAAKFSFLKESDPYNSYYQSKIGEVENLAGNEIKGEDVKSQVLQDNRISDDIVVTKRPGIVNPLGHIAQSMPSKVPPEFKFLNAQPAGISAREIDCIKLTAQYTAVNGRSFLKDLVNREQRNPYFAFLQPTDLAFSFFTTLVDQYQAIYESSQKEMFVHDSSPQGNDNRAAVLEQTVHRWREQMDKERLQSKSDDMLHFSAVDWSDFSIVEVVTFDEKNNESGSTLQLPMQRIEAKHDDEDVEMDMDEDEDVEGDLTVVDDYQPKLAPADRGPMEVFDPVSGRAIDVVNVDEHMRVQLIDPRWRTEQQKFLDKQKETGIAEGDSIAANLSRFAQKRSDIFGSGASSADDQEAGSAKRAKR